MNDTSILQHHTAGLEEQLGCAPLSMVDVAFAAVFFALIKFLIVPKIATSAKFREI